MLGLLAYALPDVGPTPKALSEYLNENIDSFVEEANKIRAEFTQKNEFEAVLRRIRAGLGNAKPTIVLLVFGQTSMHYVNVVGINEKENRIAILDTDGTLSWTPFSDLDYLMNAQGYALNWTTIGNYNVISFYDAIMGYEGTYDHISSYPGQYSEG